MSTLKHRLVRIGNRIGVWMYRAFDGRLASYSRNAKVLMITTPGRRTGVLHSTCVRYLDAADGYIVWGTASGAPRDPDWFRNLRKAKTADVQIGAKTLQVRPRELLGDEREATWKNVVLAQAPEVQKYAERAGRTIPVALLQPIAGPLRLPPQLTVA
jgi:deazaflavin-dependent oxidoreductase (nitroreductase family)